jgi:hypothetical protein
MLMVESSNGNYEAALEYRNSYDRCGAQFRLVAQESKCINAKMQIELTLH